MSRMIDVTTVPSVNITLEVKRTDLATKAGLILPDYSREGDAGIDLRSVEDVKIGPNERGFVKTGIHVAIPPGYVGIIKDRSGLAHQYGIHTLAGVIDSNYRGEISIVVLNTAKDEFHIKVNDRIAQLLIVPVAKVNIVEKDLLARTNRDAKGWGSTGRS